MSNGMFGAPAGEIAADQQIQRDNLVNLDLAKGGIALKQAQLNLQSQEKMMAYLSKGFGSAGQAAAGTQSSADQTSSMMDTLARYAAASGLPQEAKQYASTASTIRRNQAYISTQAITKQIKESDLYANLLDGVHDQQSWIRANAIFAVQTGRQTPWARLPYNPKIVQTLKQGAISAKDKAMISAARAREKAQQEMIKMEQERIDLMKQQKKLSEARQARLAKTGGGTGPKPQYLESITDLMVRDFGKQVPVETMRTMARPVAERMQDILRTSPGLSPSEAAERAYQEAKADGDFAGLRKMPMPEGTKENPIKASRDMLEAPQKLQKNQYYKLPNGQIGVWNGTGFVVDDKGL
jgi:hypothetical protein